MRARSTASKPPRGVRPRPATPALLSAAHPSASASRRAPAPPARLLRAKPQPRPRRQHPPALPRTPRRARAQRGGGRRGGGARGSSGSSRATPARQRLRVRLWQSPATLPVSPPESVAPATRRRARRPGLSAQSIARCGPVDIPSLSLGHCRRNAAVVPPLPWPAEASPQRRPRRLQRTRSCLSATLHLAATWAPLQPPVQRWSPVGLG